VPFCASERARQYLNRFANSSSVTFGRATTSFSSCAKGFDLRAVPGVGAEIVLTVDGELQWTRLYRAHEQAELSGAIADTRATFEAKGWT
jgi:hypothetical protein